MTETDKNLICDCCGEKGAYQLGDINVCKDCVDYAVEMVKPIFQRGRRVKSK